MVEITVKYGRTFKKGKDYHRIDLTMRKEKSEDININTGELFHGGFNLLKNEIIKLKREILKDARI